MLTHDHACSVQLSVGWWHDGIREREAVVCALNGADEELLGDATRWSSPAARASALLARVVKRIGSISPLTLEYARELSILDRDVLLIAARQVLFGDAIQVTITCPREACGEKIDLDFKLSDLPIPVRNDQVDFILTDVGSELRCRLPNGGDQELAAHHFSTDPERAVRTILERCILEIDGARADAMRVAELSPDVLNALEAELARRDSQLENELDARCPLCGNAFTIHFDIQDFLLRELTQRHERLYREVHTLAWYYHWSEREILAMPLSKRRVYLNLLADALTETQEVES